jgi:signal transduction histidine kinase
MVEVCGGKIWAASSREEGTTFSFYLPLDNSNIEARKLQL